MVGAMPDKWCPRTILLGSDESDEPMGSKEKWWTGLPDDDRRWLLKLSRVDRRDGTVSGEDWAEWLVSRLAGLIGIPAAQTLPATFEGRRGILSRSVLHDDAEYLER